MVLKIDCTLASPWKPLKILTHGQWLSPVYTGFMGKILIPMHSWVPNPWCVSVHVKLKEGYCNSTTVSYRTIRKGDTCASENEWVGQLKVWLKDLWHISFEQLCTNVQHPNALENFMSIIVNTYEIRQKKWGLRKQQGLSRKGVAGLVNSELHPTSLQP